MQASEASRRLNEFRMAGRRSTTRAARLNKIAIEATEVCKEKREKRAITMVYMRFASRDIRN